MVTGSSNLPTEAPLSGIRVLDFTHMLAGPYCTWVLAMLGADVVKVERPGSGDFAREVAPFGASGSLYFGSINRGKRSIALDLKDQRDLEVAHRLAARSDVIVENNRPGVMNRLGLGHEDARRLNPCIVYASISGFGGTGPYRDRPAFDAIIQAMSGLMSLTGEPDGPPTRVGASVSDIGAGLFGAIGILAALASPASERDSVFLDVAMLDCQLAVLENAIGRTLNTDSVPHRVGNRHPLIVPFQSFPTADKPIVVCCDTDAQWTRFCTAIGLPGLAGDARFNTSERRSINHAILEPLLVEALAGRTADEWLRTLHAADIPASPINDIQDMVNDAHVAQRRMVVGEPGNRFVNLPVFRMTTPDAPAPRLDEHRDEILQELERLPPRRASPKS